MTLRYRLPNVPVSPLTKLNIFYHQKNALCKTSFMLFDCINIIWTYISRVTFTAEGKSRKKSKAKEEAATEMIKQLIKRQKSNNLPNYCTPFNESQ